MTLGPCLAAMADFPAAETGLKRETYTDIRTDVRQLKRKKVTWADADLDLPLAAVPDAAAAEAAGFGPGQSSSGGERAVVVLPCDGLYDALSAELLQEQVDMPPSTSEPLTRHQLLERRLGHTEQLAALYEEEMWGLLDELRLRHQQFAAVPGASAWRHDEEGDGDSEAGSTAADKLEVEEGEGGAEAAAAAAAGRGQRRKVVAAVSRSLKALWEQQQGDQAVGPAVRQAHVHVQAQPAAAAAGDKHAKPQQPVEKRAKTQQQRGQEQQRGVAGTRCQQQQQPQQAAAAAAQPPVIPRFEDVEALVLGGGAAGCLPVDEGMLLAQRQDFVQRLSLLGRLEQSALGATCRELDALGGLAVLCGRRRRYVLRRAAIAIGRCTQSQGKVDVDLSQEVAEGSTAQRVSRQQAQLFLEPDGGFRLRCTGRRIMLVNGRPLAHGQTATLPSLSHIKTGDVSLLFIANSAAVARAVHRSVQLAA